MIINVERISSKPQAILERLLRSDGIEVNKNFYKRRVLKKRKGDIS